MGEDREHPSKFTHSGCSWKWNFETNRHRKTTGPRFTALASRIDAGSFAKLVTRVRHRVSP